MATNATSSKPSDSTHLIPVGRQKLYEALRDAGVSAAQPRRNVPWINVADDGTVVFNLWRRYVTPHKDEFIADVDARDWQRYGLRGRKSQDVVDELSRQAGRWIRVIILEESTRKSRHAVGARLDNELWLVTDTGANFILRRRVDEPDAAGTPGEFTSRMLKIYKDAKEQIGYQANRFRAKVDRDGGVAAAKFWLRPKSDSTAGFQRLLDHDRVDLSVEAIVIQRRWSHLFTADELSIARNRLASVGYGAEPSRRESRPEWLPPEELDPGATYSEGSRTTIMVNAYERDPKARQRCIDHYGAKCYVCQFDFEVNYGHLGKGYIHVHHLVQLAQSGSVNTDPIVHLRPVCPNCHAMLHRTTPPMPIAELKRVLRSNIKLR